MTNTYRLHKSSVAFMTLQFIANYVKFKKENVMNIDENKE